MKCEKCKQNEATFFYEEVINGQKRALHLCGECAKHEQLNGEFEVPFPTSPFGLFEGLFGMPQRRIGRSGKLCPDCGATLHDISSTGRVGCPRCYSVFAEELEHSIRSIHGSAVHNGRTPAASAEHRQKQSKLEALKEALHTAIDEERFEDAAALRDEIQQLQSKEKGDA